MWDILRMYGVGGRLLSGVKAFYKGANACVKVNGKVGESFGIHRGVRQGCVMLPWLFNLFMDGVVREVKARAGDVGIELCMDEAKWKLNTLLFADDTVLVAENERDLQKLVLEFNTVCQRQKLKVNVKKSKVMIFEREEHDVIDFGNPYRVRTECKKQCKIKLGGQIMEEVNEFKYLGLILCKHGSMEGEICEKAIQGMAGQ